MSTYESRRKRREDVKQRATTTDNMYNYCRVIGCKYPARAGTADGLDRRYCRSHHEHYQRHGNHFKRSYNAKELQTYREVVQRWLEENREDLWVSNAIQRINGLYRKAGPKIEAFRLRGLSPRERARVAWARLRENGIDPSRPVATWLTIEMAITNDPQPVGTGEFKRVQAAKLVHRMASGTHKRWENAPGQTSGQPLEFHVYPRSRGRVLRHIGADLEQAAELLVEHHIDDVRKLL